MTPPKTNSLTTLSSDPLWVAFWKHMQAIGRGDEDNPTHIQKEFMFFLAGARAGAELAVEVTINRIMKTMLPEKDDGVPPQPVLLSGSIDDVPAPGDPVPKLQSMRPLGDVQKPKDAPLG